MSKKHARKHVWQLGKIAKARQQKVVSLRPGPVDVDEDDQECAAIFDDLEDLMNQRGGEWDFKKNHDVQRCSSPSPSQRFGSG